jgi:hypothetical protein
MNDHKGYLMHGLGAVVVMMTMVDRLPLTLDPCLLFPVWFWASHYKGTTGTSRPRRQPRIHLMTRCSSTAYYVLYVGSCGRRVCLVNLGQALYVSSAVDGADALLVKMGVTACLTLPLRCLDALE